MAGPHFAVVETVLRSGSLDTDLAWAADAGVTAVGLDGSSVWHHRAEDVRSMLAMRRLAASSLDGLPGAIDLRAGLDEAERRLQWCAQAGVPSINAHPGPLDGRSYSQADKEVRTALELVGPLAAQIGLRVAIEPVHPLLSTVTFVHTLRHAIELTGDVPATGITFDLAHLFWDRHVYDDLRDGISKIVTVQIADVDRAAMAEYRYARCQLGEGTAPLEDIMLSLKDVGYRGYYEFESVRSLPRAERVGYVRAARAWFDTFWEQHSQGLTERTCT